MIRVGRNSKRYLGQCRLSGKRKSSAGSEQVPLEIIVTDEQVDEIRFEHFSPIVFWCIVRTHREAFNLFDKDSDGVITVKELGSAMRSLGQNPTEKELAEMINEVDLDRNGALEWEEFLKLMIQREQEANVEDEVVSSRHIFINTARKLFYIIIKAEIGFQNVRQRRQWYDYRR